MSCLLPGLLLVPWAAERNMEGEHALSSSPGESQGCSHVRGTGHFRDPEPVAALVEPRSVWCPVSTTPSFFPHCLSVLPSLLHFELQRAEMGRGAVTNAFKDEMGFKQVKQITKV